jgi:hypothetical protein
MRLDRIFAAAFVVLVSTAIIGYSAGNTSASFTAATTNPGQSLATPTVAAPATNAATSAIAGRVDLSWPVTTTPPSGHTVTYLVLRNGVQIGTTASLTYSDTPAADGTYSYTVQTKIAQGAGFFTSGNSPAASGNSDRTAPTMSITCNGGSCAGWFNVSVTPVVTGNDGAGTGMASVTTSRDGAANGTTAGASRTDAALTTSSATHSIAYFGTDNVGNVSGTVTQTIQIDTTPPTAASAPTAVAGQNNGDVDLTWTLGTDALSGVASQTLRRTNITAACPAATVGNYPNVVPGVIVTTTAITNSGLPAGGYCFYVVTTDAAGNSTNSAVSVLVTAQ